jgi:hypothetical protein
MRRTALLLSALICAGLVGPGVAHGVDRQAPSRVTPKFVPRSKIAKNGTVPILLRWTYLGDIAQVERFILMESTNGGAYHAVLRNLVQSAEVALDPNGETYAFKVRARLRCDSCSESAFSAFSDPRPFALIAYQEDAPEITYDGPWTLDSPLAKSWGGEVTHTEKRGARALFDFFGFAAAYVGSRGPGYSKFFATVDGAFKERCTLGEHPGFVARRLIFRYNWGSNGSHELGIDPNRYNLRIDVDGYVVLRYV